MIAEHRIAPRRVRFDWSEIPLHWVPGDPFTTHVGNVLNLLLPPGERWFCKVFVEALPHVRDPALAEVVRGFIQQEGTHAAAHASFIRALHAHGLDTEGFDRELRNLFKRFLSDPPPPLRVLGGERRWLVFRVGLIAAIELFTCVLGQWVLEQRGLDAAGADPTMLELLRWHGAEEVEHRSVAFDLLQHLGGASRAQRALHMSIAAPMFGGLWLRGARMLFRQDPATRDLAALPRRALVRRTQRVAHTTGRLPPLGLFREAIGRYLEPGFHPSQEGSLDVALAYLQGSPAVGTPSRARVERST